MAVTESDGPAGPEWIYQGDQELKADPSSLRGYGENVAALGSNFRDDLTGPVMMLHGGGEDVALSTGGFPEGRLCQDEAFTNASQISEFLIHLSTNLAAIPSAALILADLYESADDENAISLNAIDYAFALPGAEEPDGLPDYIDGTTISEQMQGGGGDLPVFGDEQLLATYTFPGGETNIYATPDGGTRTVTRTGDTMTSTTHREDGTIALHVTSQPDGSSTTKAYGEDGELLTTTTTHVNSDIDDADDVEHEERISVTTDADGEVQSETSQHVVTTYDDDGTQTREYYDIDEDGNRVNERHISAQPEPKSAADWADDTQNQFDQIRNQSGM